MITRLLALVCTALALLHAPSANAENKFPSRPITVVVGFAAGGVGDLISRTLVDFIGAKRGAAAAVEFRPGGGSTLAAGQIARMKPDGYVVALASPSALAVAPNVQKVPYDPSKDFTYLAQILITPLPIYVKADSPFKTYKDLLDYARANPGKLRWGTAGARGVAHISVEAAFRQEGIRTTFVPFGGGSEAITALLGGHIEAAASTDYGPHLDAGSLRLLVETGPSKIPGQEHVPTFKELGYPITAGTFYGYFGPPGMSAETIAWWETTLREFVASPEFAEMAKKIRSTGAYQNSADFTQTMVGLYHGFKRLMPELGFSRN